MKKKLFVTGLLLSIGGLLILLASVRGSLENPPQLDYFYTGTRFWERWLTTLLVLSNIGPFVLSVAATMLVARLFQSSARLEVAVFAFVTIAAMAAWWYWIAILLNKIIERMKKP